MSTIVIASLCPPLNVYAVWQEGHPQPPSFTFYIDHGVSEQQTIPGQWPWRTTADALVPAGHTKLYSSQLVSLSL